MRIELLIRVIDLALLTIFSLIGLLVLWVCVSYWWENRKPTTKDKDSGYYR